MSFKKLLTGFGLASALAVGAALSAGSVMAEDTYTLRFSADSPSTGNVCSGFVKDWADTIAENSNGRLKVELFCDGMLSKIGKTVDAAATGIADAGWDLPFAYGKRFATLGVVGVPGLYRDSEIAAGALWRLYEAGKAPVDLSGVKLLWLQAVPNTAYYLDKKPPSNTDFSGVSVAMGSKMRAIMVKTMGGVPISLSPPEYYQAISKGVANGAQSTVGAISAQKIDELTNYYLYGSFGAGYTFAVMNQAKFDALPDDLKKILDDNTGYSMSRKSAAFLRDFEDDYLKNTMLKKEGTEYHELTEAEAAEWQKAFDAASSDWVESTPNGAQILADFKALLAEEREKYGSN